MWAFAVNFAVLGLFVVYKEVLSLGPLQICRGMLLGSLIMAVLYHGSLVLARHEVARLFERFGGFRFVRLCLLVSPIFAGFLSVLLSTLLSAFSSCLLNCGLFGLQMACYSRQSRESRTQRGGILSLLLFLFLEPLGEFVLHFCSNVCKGFSLC